VDFKSFVVVVVVVVSEMLARSLLGRLWFISDDKLIDGVDLEFGDLSKTDDKELHTGE